MIVVMHTCNWVVTTANICEDSTVDEWGFSIEWSNLPGNGQTSRESQLRSLCKQRMETKRIRAKIK